MNAPTDLHDLRRLQAGGAPLRYRFFLDYQPPGDGTVTDACLSQWWPCLFKVFGEYFNSAEQYMMHQKALLFGDRETAAHILDTDHPFAAKMLGRSVRDFDQEAWEAARTGIVVQGNMAKFQQDARLGAYLLATGDDILAEASPVDTVWGTGCEADALIARDPSRWPGESLLGFALMHVRGALRAAAPTAVSAAGAR